MSDSPIKNVVREVMLERWAQDKKWGEQNHPSFDQVLINREGGVTPERMAERYEIPPEWRAKGTCQQEFARGQGTWMDVLQEEVSEACAAFGDPQALRAELLQVAAVACAWVELLDRQTHQAGGASVHLPLRRACSHRA